MAALPRPDLPPGPRRELVDALHRLHHEAGWPSLRSLAVEAGCSHTTVSSVFSSPRLPSWGVLELIVEAMGGDVAEFHVRWLAASGPEGATPRSATRIAGRRAEVAAVRRHLETGAGLLLVTGEAGIGKTRLVGTAALSPAGLFVARGVPIVGTWRRDDLTVPSEVRDWLSRVRRLPQVDELALGPLTRDGTAEQLALLTGEQPASATVDRIYRRTAGQPLFTEQLVAHGGDDQALPDLLADLLDRRLEGLDDDAWRIARVLGVADRPLADVVLEEVTSLPPAALAAGLHRLADRRLLRSHTGRVVELRHPLLAEAMRRRLV